MKMINKILNKVGYYNSKQLCEGTVCIYCGKFLLNTHHPFNWSICKKCDDEIKKSILMLTEEEYDLLIIPKDFSRMPGTQYISEGINSGEKFRDTLLYPMIIESIKNKKKLKVDLDGCCGYACSFLEESFGGLIKVYGLDYKTVMKTLILKSQDEPYLVDRIYRYIKEANDTIKEAPVRGLRSKGNFFEDSANPIPYKDGTIIYALKYSYNDYIIKPDIYKGGYTEYEYGKYNEGWFTKLYLAERNLENCYEKRNKVNKIDLTEFTEEKSDKDVLFGEDNGKKARKIFKLNKIDSNNDTIIVYIPDKICCVTTSFFKGMFEDSLIKLGEIDFNGKYKFECSNHAYSDIKNFIEMLSKRYRGGI